MTGKSTGQVLSLELLQWAGNLKVLDEVPKETANDRQQAPTAAVSICLNARDGRGVEID